MRESTVEKYLHDQVTAKGGTTRKFKGRRNNPDRIVIWPEFKTFAAHIGIYETTPVRIHFVETKAPGKGARDGQKREHLRLRKLGCTVCVLDTKAKVDRYVSLYR